MPLSIQKRALLRKIAESVEMSFDVPESEKEIARDASMRFEAANKSLYDAVDHLDIIYAPFKKHEKISTKSIIKRRGILNRFKQASKEKFNNFKKRAFVAIRKLDYFSKGDQDIRELITSFEAAINELEEKLSDFYDAISDYRSPGFRDNVLSSIEDVRESQESIDELISDRIIEHIDTEILAKTWLSGQKDQFNVVDEEKKSLITELFEERQKLLNPESFPNQEKMNQALNPSDAQKAYYPDHVRTMNIGETGERK